MLLDMLNGNVKLLVCDKENLGTNRGRSSCDVTELV